MTPELLWDWALINSALRLALTLLLTYKIIAHGYQLIFLERLGMGLMGGAGLMSIPVILANATKSTSPFDGWTTGVMTLGALLYFSGRLSRHRRHAKANRMAVEQAKQYLRAKREGPLSPGDPDRRA